MVNRLISKRCTSKKVHAEHTWWSRRNKCYYRCFGRDIPYGSK